MRIYTGGTFDLFHRGHLEFLKKCDWLSDWKKTYSANEVTVSLNTDEFIEKYKGKPPIMSYKERASVLRACEYVDYVVENSGGADSKPAILEVQPDAVVIGTDWADRDYYKQMQFTQEWLDNRGIQLIYVPYTKGISTTKIKERVINANGS